MESVAHEQRTGTTWAIKRGVIGGLVAGTIFLIAAMIGSVVLGGELLAPFQAFASIPLGQMPPEIAIATALPVGLITHAVLSVIYGVAFAFAVASLPVLRGSMTNLLLAGTTYGILLFILNFLILPNIIGRPWFASAPLVPQFVYHAFFWGTVLGGYFGSQSRERSA
ncbi:hypothetical protein BH20CHL6_BH20CHL6_11820 [soil metagenome]